MHSWNRVVKWLNSFIIQVILGHRLTVSSDIGLTCGEHVSGEMFKCVGKDNEQQTGRLSKFWKDLYYSVLALYCFRAF